MAQTIKLKRSATAGNTPTTSQLALGELGINTTDGKLFLKKSVSGTESIVDVGGLPLSGGTLTGNLNLGDNVKAQFGASDDLQIYHDGNNSIISDVGTGHLNLRGTNTYLQNSDGTANYLVAIQGDETKLYFNNSAKIATTATGADITGVLTADGLTVDSTTGFSWLPVSTAGAKLGAIGTGSSVIFNTPSVNANYGSGLAIDGSYASGLSSVNIKAFGAKYNSYGSELNLFTSSGTSLLKRLAIASNGDISFYDSSGSSQNLFWDSSTSRLGLGTTAPSAPLAVHSALSGGGAIAEFRSTGNSHSIIDLRADGTGDPKIFFDLNGATPFAIGVDNSDGDKFKISNNYNLGTNDRLTIDSAGNINIGSSLMVGSTSAPTAFSGYVTLHHKNPSGDAIHLIESDGGIIGQTFVNDASGVVTTGSRSNHPWRVTTNDTERMRIDSSGRVGIGTSSPSYKLDIFNNTTNTGSQLRVKNSYVSASADSVINIDGYGASTLKIWRNGIEEWKLDRPAGSDNLGLYAYGAAVNDGAGAGLVQSWDYDTGNVNIPNGSLMVGATTAPDRKLHVKDSNYRVAVFERTGSANSYIVLKDPNTTTDVGIGATTNDLKFRSGNSDNMSLSSSGNLNIPNGSLMVGSTTAPSQALEIKKSGNNGNVALKIHNTGTATNDDALIGFLTQGNRNYSLGVHRDSGSFTLSNQDASVASGELLTIANNGNATFSNTLEVNSHRYFDSDYNVTYYRKANHTTLGYQLHRDNGNSYYEWNTGGNHSHDFQFLSNNSKILNLATNGNVNIPNGNLMVGSTTAPSHKLEVDGTFRTTGTVTHNGANLDLRADNARLLIEEADGTDITWLGDHTGGGHGALYLYNHGGTATVRLTADSHANYINNGNNFGIGTDSPVTLKSSTTLQVSGNAKLGDDNGRGLLSLGDISSTGANVGVWRGAAGAYAGAGNYLNLGGYDGITFTTGTSEIASQTERFRIDSSGSVNISGSASGTEQFRVGNSTGGTDFGITVTENSGVVLNSAEGSSARSMTFSTGGSPKMTLTSGGNLLVGTSNTTWQTQEGLRYFNGSSLIVTRDSDEPMSLNRLTNDGDLLILRRNGTAVGKIGSFSGVVSYIALDPRTSGVNGSGLMGGSVSQTEGTIQPTNGAGAKDDAAINLGVSTNRFKDLYLSGTANVGSEVVLADSGTAKFAIGNSGNDFYIYSNAAGSERMRIDSSGRVGIGTQVPDAKLSVTSSTINSEDILYLKSGADNVNDYLGIAWELGVGGNGPHSAIRTFGGPSGSDVRLGFLTTSDGGSTLTEALSVAHNGNVGIGTSSPTVGKLQVNDGSGAIVAITRTSGATSGNLGVIRFGNTDIDSNLANITAIQDGSTTSSALTFETQSTGGATAERTRIASNGTLYHGKTADSLNTGGLQTLISGQTSITQSYTEPLRLNRMSSQGAIQKFYYNGGEVGSIQTRAGIVSTIVLDPRSGQGAGLTGAGAGGDTLRHITPTNESGVEVNGKVSLGNSINGFKDLHLSGKIYGSTLGIGDAGIQADQYSNAVKPFRPDITSGTSDNYLDLGTSSVRWVDIYATNGTIQTSDRNEKQDIEDLTEAEERVAMAAKGLLKKFRWKSAVEDKGDDARIHFGIIAQDLQDAFEAEGLDAGRYGMFISTTWTDEDGEEQTRMGVRYSELLAFIISAI